MQQIYKLKVFQTKNFFIALFLGFLLTVLILISPIFVQQFSKVKGNIKSDEFIDWVDARVQITYDTTSNSVLREKLKKELKARKLRNKQKRNK